MTEIERAGERKEGGRGRAAKRERGGGQRDRETDKRRHAEVERDGEMNR